MPVTLGILGFLALLGCAGAGLAMWLVMRLTDRVTSLEKQGRTLALECRALHQQIDAIAVVRPASVPAEPVFATPITLDTGMNLSKRVQILRLNRRGESTAHIASVLNLPLAQVELVLKLQRQTAEAPTAASG